MLATVLCSAAVPASSTTKAISAPSDAATRSIATMVLTSGGAPLGNSAAALDLETGRTDVAAKPCKRIRPCPNA